MGINASVDFIWSLKFIFEVRVIMIYNRFNRWESSTMANHSQTSRGVRGAAGNSIPYSIWREND
jgi:hypothetical protein